MPTPKKKKLLILLKVGIGIGLLVLLIGKIDFEQFKERMKQVPLQSYLLGVAIYMGGMAIRTLRWKLLLGAVEEKLPLSMLIRFQFIGTFFNQFLPTSVGGDGVRVYFLCREKVSWEKAVGSVLVEIAPDAAAQLEKTVQAIDTEGLTVALAPAGDEAPPTGDPLLIELVGQDRPGIVAELTKLLARLEVNIEELDTEIENGAWSGELLFRGKVRAHVPHSTDCERVRAALETISGDMMVDFTFE